MNETNHPVMENQKSTSNIVSHYGFTTNIYTWNDTSPNTGIVKRNNVNVHVNNDRPPHQGENRI